ncbi:MAG: NERD domain-containing protein [Anditalea sp.]
MWLSLREKSYYKFHNIILPSKSGTTQIDPLIISKYGLFIFETKNKKGWIFGSEKQSTWTQSILGWNYPFQNPLRQTFRQKRILSEFLNLDESKIQTVVYFIGDCKFKTPIPKNIIKSRVGGYIKRFQNQVLSNDDVIQIIKVIEKHLTDSTFSNRDHLRSLQKRHSSNTICPKCGSILIERTSKQGPKIGRKFLGCGNYPKCRFTKSA